MCENALNNNTQKELQEKLSKITKPEDLLILWSEWVNDVSLPMAYRIKVSELIAKTNGMFITKVEIKNTNYSDILNNARKRLSDINTINITPENIDNNNTENIVN